MKKLLIRISYLSLALFIVLSFSKDETDHSKIIPSDDPYSVELSVDTMKKYELAIDNLQVINHYTGLKTVQQVSVTDEGYVSSVNLTRRKAGLKSMKYQGSFYGVYALY